MYCKSFLRITIALSFVFSAFYPARAMEIRSDKDSPVRPLDHIDSVSVIQEVPVLRQVEVKPTYDGDLQEFLRENLKYPEEAEKEGVQGLVIVEFVVKSDGSLEQFKVKSKNLGYGCEEEAIRLLESTSGQWNPGKVKGEPVNCYFTVPIAFKLS